MLTFGFLFDLKLNKLCYPTVLTGSKDGTMILGEIEAGIQLAV